MDVKTEPGGIIAEQPSDQEATNIDSIGTKIKEEPTNELQQQQQQQQQGHQESQDATNDNNNNNGQGGVSGDSATNTAGENDDDEEDAEFDNEDETESNKNDQNGVKQEEGEKTNLIVNYLPQLMTDEEFENLFKKFGKMKSCKIVRNRITGYSYGFGFADFETHEQALKAIEELNGQEVGTKKIKVAFARPAGQDIKQANLYVKNVPSSWSQDDVRKVFEPYGSIIQVRVLGNDRGVAFVLFDLRKQAQDALDALNGKQVDGCEAPFEIKFAAEKKTEKQQSTRRGGRNNNDRQGRRGGRIDQRGGNNFAGGRNNNNQQQNNRNNRSHSDNRRGTSQGRGGQGGNMFMNKNNSMNGNIGPMRQQPASRMNRYAPFIPVQQPQPMAPQPTPMTPYGYAPQQPMIPYMMAGQSMMQMPMAQQPIHPMGGAPVNPYSMGHHQIGPIGYAPPPMAQPSTTMNNMYNVASNTLNNAAQMQPQLGQPMSMRSGPGAASSSGSGGGGGGSSGGNQADGVTLFVYNIGPDCDESELKGMFAPYGSIIRCNVVRKTPGGETKGFGFVTFRNRDQANAAIAAMNNSMRNGRSLQVSFKK